MMPAKIFDNLPSISSTLLWAARLCAAIASLLILAAAFIPILVIIKDTLHVDGYSVNCNEETGQCSHDKGKDEEIGKTKADVYRLSWGFILLGAFIILTYQLPRWLCSDEKSTESLRVVGKVVCFIGGLLILTAAVLVLDCLIWGDIDVVVLFGAIGRAWHYASIGIILLIVGIAVHVLHYILFRDQTDNNSADGFEASSNKGRYSMY